MFWNKFLKPCQKKSFYIFVIHYWLMANFFSASINCPILRLAPHPHCPFPLPSDGLLPSYTDEKHTTESDAPIRLQPFCLSTSFLFLFPALLILNYKVWISKSPSPFLCFAPAIFPRPRERLCRWEDGQA